MISNREWATIYEFEQGLEIQGDDDFLVLFTKEHGFAVCSLTELGSEGVDSVRAAMQVD